MAHEPYVPVWVRRLQLRSRLMSPESGRAFAERCSKEGLTEAKVDDTTFYYTAAPAGSVLLGVYVHLGNDDGEFVAPACTYHVRDVANRQLVGWLLKRACP